MKEYTLLAILSVLIAIGADLFLKTKLIRNKKFWVFWCVMLILIFLINGYLTWRPVVLYGNDFFLNVRLFTIPVEDFLYGFGLISLNIVLWEYFTKRWAKK